MTRTTIRDVAAKAGVSVATVSVVLNDRPGARIPASTERRVREAAAELEYRSSSLARNLRRRTTSTIGFLSDEIATTPYAVRMVEAASDVARENGLLLMLVNTGNDPGVETSAIAELAGHHVDRYVYALMHHRVVDVPERLGDNVVVLDGQDRSGRHLSVAPDEVRAAIEAVDHLLALGHRRIAFLTDHDEEAVATGLRLEGYRTALERAGIPFDPRLVAYGNGRGEPGGGETAADEVLALSERPTALFCFNDRMAMGAYRSIRRHGLRIPEDISVVGFDDLELIAGHLDPPLTTMALPHYEMGRWAMQALLDEARPDEGAAHLMHCPIVVRASTGAPPDLGVETDPVAPVNPLGLASATPSAPDSDV